MSLTYDAWVTTMQTMLQATDAAGQALFTTLAPRMVEYAELRIYRDLDFLSTVGTSEIAMTPGQRSLAIPAGTFVVIESANAITPASTPADSGTRNPMTRVTKAFLDAVCPSASDTGVPKWWTVLTETTNASTASAGQTILLGLVPDQAYVAEFTGTMRPAPMSASNETTFISLYLPDLLVSASMIFGAGYQRDFGSAADDPKLAMSWEQTYQTQLKGAMTEEMRKKAESWSWQPYFPPVIAQGSRPQT